MTPEEKQERMENRIIEMREKGTDYKSIARRMRISRHRVRFIISEFRPDLEVDARTIRRTL